MNFIVRNEEINLVQMAKKTIIWDLDDVLCDRPTEAEVFGVPEKYKYCRPIYSAINTLNECHYKGHTNIIFTARGQTSLGGDLKKIEELIRPVTEELLKAWGVQYDRLIFGKPSGDLWIDNLGFNSSEISTYEDIEAALKRV